MKKGRGMSKGSSFEREMCKKLSLWWTDGKRDDIYWRTAGSGARAKARNKTGKSTFGQYGDVQATDPIGQPLIDLCSIELKRGYNTVSIDDFLNSKIKEPMLQSFIEQAVTDCRLRKDDSEWILIVKRDRKEAVLFTSLYFLKCFPEYAHTFFPIPTVKMRVRIKRRWRNIVALRLDDFLSSITSDEVRKVWQWKVKTKRKKTKAEAY